MPYGISKIIIKYERSMKNKRKQPAKNIWNAQICKRKQKNTIECTKKCSIYMECTKTSHSLTIYYAEKHVFREDTSSTTMLQCHNTIDYLHLH